jgi:hypothetical protein
MMSKLEKPEPKKRVRGQTNVKTKGYEIRGGRARDAGSLDLANGNGVYVLVERKECCDGFTGADISTAQKVLGLTAIYGIPKRFSKYIGAGWKHLKVSISEAHAAENSKLDLTELNSYTISKESKIESVLDGNMTKTLIKAVKSGKIEDNTSPFAKWIEESEEINKLAVKYPEGSTDRLVTLARLAGQALQTSGTNAPPLNVVKVLAACQKKYPLLFTVAHDWQVLRDWNAMSEEIIFYINAKNNA